MKDSPWADAVADIEAAVKECEAANDANAGHGRNLEKWLADNRIPTHSMSCTSATVTRIGWRFGDADKIVVWAGMGSPLPKPWAECPRHVKAASFPHIEQLLRQTAALYRTEE